MLERQTPMDIADRESVRADLDQAMMAAFCRALNASGLTPMAVMSAMAGALGAVYRQVADSHRRGECPCGWQPAGASDIDMLQTIFRMAASAPPANELLTMPIQGRA
ncbi:MAG: hypothetical protein J0G95_10260 [Rhizobiales bacterium]|nr:hypothetical protein [Hyphomicrobiales bacterium]